jgi:hypothetical protein
VSPMPLCCVDEALTIFLGRRPSAQELSEFIRTCEECKKRFNGCKACGVKLAEEHPTSVEYEELQNSRAPFVDRGPKSYSSQVLVYGTPAPNLDEYDFFPWRKP